MRANVPESTSEPPEKALKDPATALWDTVPTTVVVMPWVVKVIANVEPTIVPETGPLSPSASEIDPVSVFPVCVNVACTGKVPEASVDVPLHCPVALT